MPYNRVVCDRKSGFESRARKVNSMSEQQTSLTYEGVLELFRESDRRFVLMSQELDRKFQETKQMIHETSEQMKETDRQMQKTDRQMQETTEQMKETDRKLAIMSQKTDRQMKETDRKISALGSRIGEIVENMIGGDIVPQFRELGYNITQYARNHRFGLKGTTDSGEIDLFLYDGEFAILIEAKTNLKTDDVREHIDRLEKYRRCVEANKSDQRRYRFIGAVAGAVVEDNVAAFAQKQGLYVIVQSGRAVEIIPSPEGFVPKTW